MYGALDLVVSRARSCLSFAEIASPPISFKEVLSRGRKGLVQHLFPSAVTESESVEIDRIDLSLAGAAAPFLPSDKNLSSARLHTSSKRPGPEKATATPVSAAFR